MYVCWKHLLLPDPTPVQYDIAYFLQHGPKRLIIEAFRGIGKSWITSAYVCWLLYCNPRLNILVVSASKNRSDDFSTFTQRLIYEMPILKHLRPGPNDRFSKVAFDVAGAGASHAPSVKSAGITGQITGSRADEIIADDIEVANNSDTQMKRDKLSEQVKEFDAILKPGGRIKFLGTPQNEQSIYNKMPERGYVVRIWPALFPTEAQRAKYGSKLAPMIGDRIDASPEARERLEGHSTDPQRFSDEDLAERLLSYGRSGFALQFMLDTSLSDAEKFPLKASDLIVMSLNPKLAPSEVIWGTSPELVHNELPNVAMSGDRLYRPMFVSDDFMEYEYAMMWVDPSGKGKDETSYAVVKMLNGRLFVTACGGFKGTGYDDDTLNKLLKVAKMQDVPLIQVEPNFGDGMFAQMLRARAQVVHPCTIEDGDWSSNQKEARIIDTLEPVMNQHRLVISDELIEQDYNSTIGYGTEKENQYRLIYQLTRITREKGSLVHDDRLDALAGAVRYWNDRMNRNTDVSMEERNQSLLEQAAEQFLSTGGFSMRAADNWMSNY